MSDLEWEVTQNGAVIAGFVLKYDAYRMFMLLEWEDDTADEGKAWHDYRDGLVSSALKRKNPMTDKHSG